jgi:hypothetical protein
MIQNKRMELINFQFPNGKKKAEHLTLIYKKLEVRTKPNRWLTVSVVTGTVWELEVLGSKVKNVDLKKTFFIFFISFFS